MKNFIIPSFTKTIAILESNNLLPIGKIYCVGKNYRDHAEEMNEGNINEPPFFFSKPPQALTQKTIVKYPEDTTDLQYEVELVDNGQFEIKAESSEVESTNDGQNISMSDVMAIFIDKINRKIEIRSNKANFNTISNNINFFGDIKVKYLNNLIFAKKLDFNYKNNNIKIHENIIYKGSYGSVEADNIEINLTTKNLTVFMNNQNDKIKIIGNR